jgi:hypothetical protein
MTQRVSIARFGATGTGKSFACASDVIVSPDAEVVLDPEKDSLASIVLTHATGDILYDRLDDLVHALSYDMLTASTHPDPAHQYQENYRKAEAFAAILLRRRDADNFAHTPLLAEWIFAALMLYLQGDQG